MASASAAGSSCNATSVDVEIRDGSATSIVDEARFFTSAISACASWTHESKVSSPLKVSACACDFLTSATPASNASRRSPNGSRGQNALSGLTSFGLRTPSSGALASLSNTPPRLSATSVTWANNSLGSTLLEPSRHHDVVQSRCVRARVTAT